MSVLVEPIVRPCPETEGDDSDAERTREWLVSNGLGGYASGTVSGVPTRRYHGLLVAALPTPLGRMMMLDRLNERLGLPDGSFAPIGVEALVGRP
ncbi:MAG: glycogen debranching enzyme N-terminal domain-containing protein, partial [Isosphaeraceae bacterium]